jgi:uncharacterized lipoprotein YddW (UPF0748 family)
MLLFTFKVSAQRDSVKAEMRAVWVATVDNIDWPDYAGSSSEEQQAAFIRLLNTHQCNGINTIIVQIRPSRDAFYLSLYEPWSQWISGIQGMPPIPYYDPLTFMITETHKRGMEFHAWVNPYRAVHNIYKSSISENHITKIHPEWFIDYGEKRYFDPGNKDAQDYVVEVVNDIVKRYDVDAIHIDDYFYPYPLPGKHFNDATSFEIYGRGMALPDWRRRNVDSIIFRLYTNIKKIKAKCQFGVSPFGVWRNSDRDVKGSKTQAGPTDYDFLYADILLWLKMGWVDYVAPQLYWEIGHRATPCEVLIEWWSKNTFGKNCYIGLGVYKAGSNAAWKDKTQLPKQIEKIRQTPNIQGMMFFSSKPLENNVNGWGDSLRLNYFKHPAPTPKMK